MRVALGATEDLGHATAVMGTVIEVATMIEVGTVIGTGVGARTDIDIVAIITVIGQEIDEGMTGIGSSTLSKTSLNLRDQGTQSRL